MVTHRSSWCLAMAPSRLKHISSASRCRGFGARGARRLAEPRSSWKPHHAAKKKLPKDDLRGWDQLAGSSAGLGELVGSEINSSAFGRKVIAFSLKS